MAYAANLRGWGPGWPTNRIKDQVWVQAQRSRVRFQVHHGIAPIIKFLIDEVERRGYLLHVPGQTPDDWSFNSRPIHGTNRPSNHSWGLAIDIDATKYPQGQRRNQPPRWVIDLFRAYGFEYGGDWSNPDPMHFEFAGSITEARYLVASLAAGHQVGKPAPLPPTVPPVYVPPVDLAAIHRLVQEDTDMILICNGKGIAHVIDKDCWSAISVAELEQVRAAYKKAARSLPELTVSAARWNQYLS